MYEAHFQTFEEPESGVALTARLSAFREELARRKLTGFVIPRADQQQNEYVAPSEERLGWVTGLSGSPAPCARRRPIPVAGRQTGRRQGLAYRPAGRSAAGTLAGAAPFGRRPPRFCPLAA